MACESVCKKWYAAISLNSVWREAFVARFGKPGPIAAAFYDYFLSHLPFGSWKSAYTKTVDLHNDVQELLEENIDGMEDESSVVWDALRFEQLMLTYSPNETRQATLEFPDELYIVMGYAFLLFESLQFRRDDKEGLVLVGDPKGHIESEVLENYFRFVFGMALVIVSGDSFPQKKRTRGVVGNLCADIVGRAKELAIPYDVGDEQGILLHTWSFMEASTLVEIEKKNLLKAKIINLLEISDKSSRLYYNNSACTYFLFGENETGFKYLRWTFDYFEGKYKKKWLSSRYRRFVDSDKLVENLGADQDFASVRDTEEFKEIVKFAKKQLRAEHKLVTDSDEESSSDGDE